MSRKLKPLKFVRQREEGGKKAKWAMDGTNDGSEGSLSLSPKRQQGEGKSDGGDKTLRIGSQEKRESFLGR